MRFLIYLIIILLVNVSFIFPNTLKYKIRFLGIPVAECIINYSDTTVYNIESIKMEYIVNSNSLINKFFKVDNHYKIIVDKNKFNTLVYEKYTYQPNITNNIKTSYNGEFVKYNNSDIKINQNDKNIFTILYLIQTGKINVLENINFLEREGKYYNFNLKQLSSNKFELLIDEFNSKDVGLIENTDIFLWGLFLSDTRKKIIINTNKQYIEKCIFKKGLTTITAKYVK